VAQAELLAGGRLSIRRREPPAPPPPPLTLAVAIPRLPRLEWLVEKLAELDVARLVLLRTRHGERDVGDARLARLRRLADEALLQCGRSWRLAIDGPLELPAALAGRGGADAWLATPEAAAGPAPAAGPAGVLACIGPEGGFAADELSALRAAGACEVRLGRTVLRVETAAVALAVLALDRLGDVPADGAGRSLR
jgi:16S rRNA (uracil1498-N3)-methyltransferase